MPLTRPIRSPLSAIAGQAKAMGIVAMLALFGTSPTLRASRPFYGPAIYPKSIIVLGVELREVFSSSSERKIRNAVVAPIMIDVMDNLVRLQCSTEVLRHHQSMLSLVAARTISTGDSYSPITLSVVCLPALPSGVSWSATFAKIRVIPIHGDAPPGLCGTPMRTKLGTLRPTQPSKDGSTLSAGFCVIGHWGKRYAEA